MKVLFAIPHYYENDPKRTYGSCGDDSSETRALAISQQIINLYSSFGGIQICAGNDLILANSDSCNKISIVVCTTGGKHCLDKVTIDSSYFEHYETDTEDMKLGFECQKVLRERLGDYDYYCYLEDDLIISDPYFITKVRMLTNKYGNKVLLQPNRYEVPTLGKYADCSKVYIDYQLPIHMTNIYQDYSKNPKLYLDAFGKKVEIERNQNPHSGCYFLNATQMKWWSNQPYFLDRDCSWVGPLESAATLGIMRTFDIYKPAMQNACFLEICHFGEVWIKKLYEYGLLKGNM